MRMFALISSEKFSNSLSKFCKVITSALIKTFLTILSTFRLILIIKKYIETGLDVVDLPNLNRVIQIRLIIVRIKAFVLNQLTVRVDEVENAVHQVRKFLFVYFLFHTMNCQNLFELFLAAWLGKQEKHRYQEQKLDLVFFIWLNYVHLKERFQKLVQHFAMMNPQTLEPQHACTIFY